MGENLVSQVNSIQPAENNTLTIQVESLLRTAATQKPNDPAPAQETKAAGPPPVQLSSASNISLQFQIDEQTNKMTIYVVDRASKRILRSIPASELHKLKAGELLKLTA